jgi:hypothetical protein
MANFTARLPLQLKEQTKWIAHAPQPAGGWYAPIPAYTNPLVDRLRAKLKKQRFKYTEEIDGGFIIFPQVQK